MKYLGRCSNVRKAFETGIPRHRAHHAADLRRAGAAERAGQSLHPSAGFESEQQRGAELPRDLRAHRFRSRHLRRDPSNWISIDEQETIINLCDHLNACEFSDAPLANHLHDFGAIHEL